MFFGFMKIYGTEVLLKHVFYRAGSTLSKWKRMTVKPERHVRIDEARDGYSSIYAGKTMRIFSTVTAEQEAQSNRPAILCMTYKRTSTGLERFRQSPEVSGTFRTTPFAVYIEVNQIINELKLKFHENSEVKSRKTA
ncbi:MAG: hypothetical protein LBH60_05680 [Prevotellaceae bacterium]|jgi:hypothetical protein|nr:hypothetical protein [Prevotellaceae bacterium]